MFGSTKQAGPSDQLPVTVHVVHSAEVFAAAQKLWKENLRTLYQDHASGKELLHFALLNPKTVIWLQHDINSQNEFELVMSWTENKTLLADVWILLPGPDKSGDDSFPRKVLDALLTTPATVPVAAKKD
jgi:hypothetical protein